MTIEEVKRALHLVPHPAEGGFFAETYRSTDSFSDPRYPGPRSLSTAIYYLLTPGTFSALHRLPTDEIFHFYLGDPVTMLQLRPDGDSLLLTLGQDIAAAIRQARQGS